MAIIVEEEKKSGNAARMLGWVVFIVVVAIAVYYVFFAEPQPAILSAPQGSATVTPLAQLNVKPDSVTLNPTYQSLKQYVPSPSPQGPTAVGRTNPFIAP